MKLSLASIPQYAGLILLILIMLLIPLSPILFPDQTSGIAFAAKDFALSFGIWAPLILIGMLILATIFTPIPNTLITIAIGATLGPVFGFIVAIVGNVLASLTAFFISRIFGEKYVEKYFPQIHKWHGFIRDNGFITVFVLRLIPPVSFDLVSYAAGLTKMNWRTFAVATFLGSIPNTIALVLVGAGITYDSQFSWTGTILFLALIIAGFVLAKKMKLGDTFLEG